jgi:hypothetical protein
MSDYAFIDRLQDMHGKALGFMPKKQLEGKIIAGHLLVAEDETRLPIGYCMSQDRYFKRDDVGIVYQMNVSPGAQRRFVAATLLKAVFERAAYGCKLFCCWCAQDLDANYFWESLGFIPLAFRTGASGKRTHIFWQRRIRAGDVTTPYWFPAKTDAGSMREDRLVFPIPPGMHWKDPMPVIIPVATQALGHGGKEIQKRKPKVPHSEGPVRMCQGQFAPPSRKSQQQSPEQALAVVEKPKAQKKPAREKVKADPRHIAAARELRDRYLEQFNSGLMLGNAKYEVARALPASAAPIEAKQLSQAA